MLFTLEIHSLFLLTSENFVHVCHGNQPEEDQVYLCVRSGKKTAHFFQIGNIIPSDKLLGSC